MSFLNFSHPFLHQVHWGFVWKPQMQELIQPGYMYCCSLIDDTAGTPYRVLDARAPRDPPCGKSSDKESRQMVTMSSFGKFHRGSNTELFREITTIHASLLHSRIAVRIPLGQSKSIHSRLIRRRRIAWIRYGSTRKPTVRIDPYVARLAALIA